MKKKSNFKLGYKERVSAFGYLTTLENVTDESAISWAIKECKSMLRNNKVIDRYEILITDAAPEDFLFCEWLYSVEVTRSIDMLTNRHCMDVLVFDYINSKIIRNTSSERLQKFMRQCKAETECNNKSIETAGRCIEQKRDLSYITD